MNVWEVLLTVLGWIILVAITIIALLILVEIVRRLISTAKTRKAANGAETLSDEAIKELAAGAAKELYKSDIFFGTSHEATFKKGVDFALLAKGGKNANRI